MRIRGYFSLITGVVILMVTSCSDDDPGYGNDSIVLTGEGSMEVLSPASQIDFIQETAGLIINNLHPEDQREFLLNAAFAKLAYGELRAPQEWRETGQKLFEAATAGITRASFNNIEPYYFSDLAGVFTPGNGEWTKTGDSDNIEFIFPGADGQSQSLIITASKETFLYSFVGEEWKGSDVYYTSTAIYIPTTIDVSYKVGGKILADGHLEFNIDALKNGSYEGNANILLNVANLSLTTDLSMSNTRLAGEYSLSLSGQKVACGAIAAHGNNLTNLQHIMLLTKTEDIIKQIKNGEAYIDILGRIQVNGKMRMTDRFFGLTTISTSTEELSQEGAETRISEAAEVFNDNTKIWVRFNNTATEQCKIVWRCETTDFPEGWISQMVPDFYFPYDKSTHTLSSLELLLLDSELNTVLEKLIADYKAIFTH